MWMSNRSVRFYPTLTLEQLIYGPWAEYSILHLDLLFGNDWLANLPQWFAYLGSAVAASLIAKSLGASLRGQLLVATASSAIPVCVLEASGAKNNCVLAFWIVTSVYFLFDFGLRPNWLNTLAFGAATALAIFTKGTAYVLLPPLVAAGWFAGNRPSRGIFFYRLPTIALLVFTINGPHYLRNYSLTGSFMGVGAPYGGEEFDFSNRNRSLAGIGANVLRYLAISLSISDSANAIVQRWTSRAIRAIGQNPDDPESIRHPHVLGLRFQTNPASAREDMGGVTLHFALAIIATTVLMTRWRKMPTVTYYTLGVIASFLFFCALLRWERWSVRYLIPLFVLESVTIGVVIDRYQSDIAVLLGLTLVGAAMPFALRNQLRPILPVHLSRQWPMIRWSGDGVLLGSRSDYYFADLRQDLKESYLSAARTLRKLNCREVGVDVSLQDVDYLLYAFLDVDRNNLKLRYVGVYNDTAGLSMESTSQPCGVVCFGCARVAEKWREYRPIGGRVTVTGDIALFGSAGELPNVDSGGDDDRKKPLDNEAKYMEASYREIKAISTWPEFANRLTQADQLARKQPDKAYQLELRENAIYRTANDASTIMLFTERVRSQAEAHQGLAPAGRNAIVAGNEALRHLVDEKIERLRELRAFEEEASNPKALPAVHGRKTSGTVERAEYDRLPGKW
jgi:hypothetical protein